MPAAPPAAVILAGGLGTRFGGTKHLAAVGADGTAIIDVLIRRAAAAGFSKAVIVVAPGAGDAVRAHIDGHRDGASSLPIELVVQPAVVGRSKPAGTAHALLATRDSVGGACAVMNADDLYPADAFGALCRHLREGAESEHALVGFRVGRTLVGDRSVSRALVEADADSVLVAIHEGSIAPAPEHDGLRFSSGSSVHPVTADQIVSMNMWGFRAPVFDELERAVGDALASAGDEEVYLPVVVAAMVAAGAQVRVLVSESRCVGVTHPEDVDAVRAALG